MRFWQAIVVAQMAAGGVWADRFDGFGPRLAADLASLGLGAGAWLVFKRAHRGERSA